MAPALLRGSTVPLLILLLAPASLAARERTRNEIRIPDIPGFIVLVCDLHTHTVFSDGLVWPTVRVDEAWREGLDALAISDHVEYPNAEIRAGQNRPFEIARPYAESAGLILVRAAEITRDLSVGHYNALFLDDADKLVEEDFQRAVKKAIDQGAFVVWNHPAWTKDDGPPAWTAVQELLLKAGHLHGIEVVNGSTYSPEAHRWCLEKKLTMMGSSDMHQPVHMAYDPPAEHRPQTLVLARTRTLQGLKEALLARRTVVHHRNQLIGEARFLRPLFEASVEILNPDVQARDRGPSFLRIRNVSDVPYSLVFSQPAGLSVPKTLEVPANRTVLLPLAAPAAKRAGVRDVVLNYTVQNLLVAPGEGLSGSFRIRLGSRPD